MKPQDSMMSQRPHAGTAPEAQRQPEAAPRRRRLSVSRSVVAAPLAILVGCGGPMIPGDGDDGFGGLPAGGGSVGIGGDISGVGGVGVGGSEPVGTGGVPVGCDTIAPQQTYVCAGFGYENSTGAAATLLVYPDSCGSYGVGGAAAGGGGGYYGIGGGYYSVGGGYYSVGGAIPAGGGEPGGEDPDVPETDPGIGEAGAPGIGGQYYYYPTGGSNQGGGPGYETGDWCNYEPTGSVLAGLSFAVGPCQDTDVALPILLQEPYYGEYVARVYGSWSGCGRDSLLATVAGIGTGQVLQIPLNTEGYGFISVEIRSEQFNEAGVRLRDRPIVVPVPPGE